MGAVLVDFIDQRLLLTLFRMGRRQMGEGIYQCFCNFADEKEITDEVVPVVAEQK